MSYTKQNFIDGSILKAEHLNKIEDGIAKNAIDIENKQPKGVYLTEHQPIKTINGQSLVGEGNIEFADDGGGSGGVLTVGMVNRSLSAENFEIDKTFEEIAAAIDAGQGVQLIFDWKKKYPEVYPLDYAERDKIDGVITGIGFGKTYLRHSGDNYTVCYRGFYISNDGAITQDEYEKTIS